jgi:hypothetical protein|tara:strand:+ start:27853 stop:27972 length:120 start_codon:yes stop_codon:yes gene_type:complete
MPELRDEFQDGRMHLVFRIGYLIDGEVAVGAALVCDSGK